MYKNDLEFLRTHNKIESIWFDMDGVLAIYERDAYISGEYKRPNSHYFLLCKPDEKMINVFLDLVFDPGCIKHIGIISSVHKNLRISEEQRKDKEDWLKIYIESKIKERMDNNNLLPQIKLSFIATFKNKDDAVKSVLNRELTSNDYLIDDFNDNLLKWKNANGTAIKYGNYVNDYVSFMKDGPVIPEDATKDEIIKFIHNL